MQVNLAVGEASDAATRRVHRAWVGYMADDRPTDSVIRADPIAATAEEGRFFAVSLDHSFWFHRPLRADRWHLYDFSCHHYIGGRGLSVGHVFTPDGLHVATVSQEVLVRDSHAKPT